MARFTPPVIQDNPGGWGPCQLPNQYKDMPYQPFSKGDRLGRIADWTESAYQGRRAQYKYNSAFANGQQYAYIYEEDDSSFKLVDTARIAKPAYQRNKAKYNMQKQQRDRKAAINASKSDILSKAQKSREQERKRQERNWQKNYGRNLQDNRNRNQNQQKLRESSIRVQEEWKVLEDMDYARLLKLQLPTVSEGKDLYTAGSLQFYDKKFDRVNCKTERKLMRMNKTVHAVTTTDDPIIRRLIREGNVFATDTILATLMCCTRSVYPWDIIVQKVKGKIFLDQREDSNLDMLTVSETAITPPDDESSSNNINAPKNLSLEATYISLNFSQQVLRDDQPKHEFENANPFAEDDPAESVTSIAYRYRKFDIGNDLNVIVRCHHDAVAQGTSGEKQFINIKALNEWDSKMSGGIDWRTKLDIQKGAVVATELKNNSFKLAKWTAGALLAGSDQIKFGFVSRVQPKDSRNHVILGLQQFKPTEFAQQMNLNMENAWGILRCMLDIIKKLDDGKYLIMKDPNKPMVRIYDIPNDSFESEEETDSESDADDSDENDSANEN